MTAAGPPAAPALHLLHLEDSMADAELIRCTLIEEWPDCHIERVQTESEYLAALRRGVFDLILSDFSIPGFDGLAALALARRLRGETPFIFLSGTIGEDNAVEALKNGATDYVIKDRLRRLNPVIQRALKEVSEHRRRQEAERQFLRAQRLESVGLLAGGMAHDLNNTLAPILMSIPMLRERSSDPESARLLDVIESSARHGAGLIQQVLAFSRGVEGERVILAPQPVIRDVARLLGETLPRAIVIETELPPTVWSVRSDSTQLGQVLMNLGVNARDAMPEGGRLRIAARNVVVDAAQAQAYPGARPGPHVLISVTDTGTGIPPAVRDRIFDPFFTTKEVGRGTGLGLSTVLGIVKSHGGFLHLRTEVGRGTEFGLFFPAVMSVDTPPASGPAEPPRKGRGETILVIDDEENVRSSVVEFLQANGYRVLAASGGAAGLDLYRQHRDEIRLVLSDLMMPAMQGAEVSRRLRAINPRVRIVAMSGLPDEPGAQDDADRLAYLQKPMSGPDLLRTLQRVLETPAPAQ
jgi:two-component system cell cycle sensor histidine kinase/response regulator CckA